MKRILPIFVLFFGLTCFAQERGSAIPVDEFGRLNCGDLLARIDNLYLQLKNNPTSSAFIVITPQRNAVVKSKYPMTFITNIFKRRSFDMSRLRIGRGPEGDSQSGSFWLIPHGGSEPEKDFHEWLPKPLGLSKPFVFGVEGDEDPCPSFPIPEYAELLKTNQNLRGHIVIFPHESNDKKRILNDWLRRLTGDLTIPRNQLRVFFGERKPTAYVEFWIVPVRKK